MSLGSMNNALLHSWHENFRKINREQPLNSAQANFVIQCWWKQLQESLKSQTCWWRFYVHKQDLHGFNFKKKILNEVKLTVGVGTCSSCHLVVPCDLSRRKISFRWLMLVSNFCRYTNIPHIYQELSVGQVLWHKQKVKVHDFSIYWRQRQTQQWISNMGFETTILFTVE